MPDALALLVLALATWRVSVLLVREEGPFSLARRVRVGAGIIHDADGMPVGYPDHTIGKALGCIWCTSFWLAWPMLLLWEWAPLLTAGIAIAALAVIIELAAGRLHHGESFNPDAPVA